VQQKLFERPRRLEVGECPFANLPRGPRRTVGRRNDRGEGAESRWAQPVLVSQFEFVELSG
jgi:hypothetical protein